ncbi:FkbM family methyltransferase [Halochromatium roseum]|uniref:FkbM family methyltransferase n=1 Tax=Halochromatium roseum TaxID=391920 RepID=UPI0019145448|nr:FkbM family methyltransferase [Halochromatium roseum]MBK5941808.1 hypothetical protein [Halochromatium roseum]
MPANDQTTPFPSKRNCIFRLLKRGFRYSCVLDVGVNYATPELINLFPNLMHYLIEPVPFYNPEIQAHYNKINHQIINCAIGKANGSCEIQTYAVDGGKKPTHAKVTEIYHEVAPDAGQLKAYKESNGATQLFEVPIYTLDSLIENYIFPSGVHENILLKIDVDSIELDILQSLSNHSSAVSALVIEAHLENCCDLIKCAQSKNYVLEEITDFCFKKGKMTQFDLVFVSQTNQLQKSTMDNDVPELIWKNWFQLSSIDPNPWNILPPD